MSFIPVDPSVTDAANEAAGAVFLEPPVAPGVRQHFPRRCVQRKESLPSLILADDKLRALRKKFAAEEAEAIANVATAAAEHQAWLELNAAHASLVQRRAELEDKAEFSKDELEAATHAHSAALIAGNADDSWQDIQKFKIHIEGLPAAFSAIEQATKEKSAELEAARKRHFKPDSK